MAHYKRYGEYAVIPRSHPDHSIFHWKKVAGSPTFKFDESTFLLTEEESFIYQNKFRLERVDFQLVWIVKRPGGSISDRTMAIKFFHKPSAFLFKLSRQLT